MGKTIKTSNQAAGDNAKLLKSGVEKYSGFRIHEIRSSIDCEGSAIRDSNISSCIAEALEAWRDIVNKDSNNIELVNAYLYGADAEASHFFW